jgi:hypothetical protein
MDAQPRVKIDSQSIKRVKHVKVPGVQIDENLNWGKHIESIASKISKVYWRNLLIETLWYW